MVKENVLLKAQVEGIVNDCSDNDNRKKNTIDDEDNDNELFRL